MNDRFENRRCVFVLIFLIPNLAGAFGLRFVPIDQKVGRLICYYLTGPYNAAFVLVLSMQVANTAGHTKKVVTNAVLFLGYCTGNIAGPFFYKSDQSYVLPSTTVERHVLTQMVQTNLQSWNLVNDSLAFD